MGILPSGLTDHIADDEDLARFLTSSRQFNATMAKPAAFLPNPNTGETSVFRHASEPREELWRIGDDYVAGGRRIHGVAIVCAGDVRVVALDVIACEPPPRHANITAWASGGDDPELTKARRKEQALLIAQRAHVIRS